jgi:hypothetical protein
VVGEQEAHQLSAAVSAFLNVVQIAILAALLRWVRGNGSK